MKKIKLSSIFNEDEENYLKINVIDNNSEDYIKTIIKILNELEISEFLQSEPEIQSAKYKDWIGTHEFLKNKKYLIHILLEESYIHLIFKCSIDNRKKLMEIIQKYCSF